MFGQNRQAFCFAVHAIFGIKRFVSGQTPVQTYFVPLPEQQLLDDTFKKIYKNAKDPINSLTSIAIAAENTVIWFDHWEDGYDQDITTPGQSSTQIWGDGDLSNGCPPNNAGVTNPCTDPTHDVLRGGDAIILNNDVELPRDNSVLKYDGGDRIQSSFPVAMTRGAFPRDPGAFLAGAVEVLNTDAWGYEYVAPVGENVRSSTVAFQHTAAFIMFSEDRTTVTLPDGSARLMYAGESLVVNDIITGDTIFADKPIQVSILAGDVRSTYELRWYSMIPRPEWNNEYYSPVGTADWAETRVWLYNPNDYGITVNWQFRGGIIGSAVVEANNYKLSDAIPNNSGARFYTDSVEDVFYAITQTEANLENNLGDTADWGHPLIPVNQLTSQALVGWGYGCTDNKCIQIGDYAGARSKVFVTPVEDGTIKVDTNGDGVVDQTINAVALESVKITDTDDDMTGALIWCTTTEQSTDPVKIAVAWGQDPETTGVGDSAALDLGTSVPPLPIIEAGKSSVLKDDADGNGFVSPGDTITYTIRVANIGQVDLPAGSWNVLDYNMPVFQDTTYVPDTVQYVVLDKKGTELSREALTDDILGTAFPLDEPGLDSRAVLEARGGVHELSFDVKVVDVDSLTPGSVTVQNEGIITLPVTNEVVDAFTHTIRAEEAAFNLMPLRLVADCRIMSF